MEKKRVIVDFNTLPDNVLEMMATKYPDGYDNDIIKFPNAKGELISAVRVETDDTIYLVKVSKQLQQMVEDFEFDDEEEDEDDEIERVIKTAPMPKEVMEDADDDDDDYDDYDRADDEDDEDDDR
jgi:DNA-directed RNA polymerase subunit delta